MLASFAPHFRSRISQVAAAEHGAALRSFAGTAPSGSGRPRARPAARTSYFTGCLAAPTPRSAPPVSFTNETPTKEITHSTMM